MRIAGVALILGLLLGPAMAAPKAGLCSPPSCFCATTSAAQACHGGGGGSASPVGALTDAKADILATLAVIDTMAQAPVEGTNGKEWAPDVHFCIAGIGSKGQPGYIPGVISWLNDIKTPPEIPQIPPGTRMSPLLVLFEADLHARALRMNLDSLISQGAGVPQDLMTSCGGLLARNGIVTLAGLVAVLVPK